MCSSPEPPAPAPSPGASLERRPAAAVSVRWLVLFNVAAPDATLEDLLGRGGACVRNTVWLTALALIIAAAPPPASIAPSRLGTVASGTWSSAYDSAPVEYGDIARATSAACRPASASSCRCASVLSSIGLSPILSLDGARGSPVLPSASPSRICPLTQLEWPGLLERGRPGALVAAGVGAAGGAGEFNAAAMPEAKRCGRVCCCLDCSGDDSARSDLLQRSRCAHKA